MVTVIFPPRYSIIDYFNLYIYILIQSILAPICVRYHLFYFPEFFKGIFKRLILEIQKKKSMEMKAVSAYSLGKQDVRRDSECQE